MRDIELKGWISSGALRRALRLAMVVFGVALVMTAGAARAEDDDDDDKTFEEKIIDNIMSGLGGTRLENRGIEYRERSPLVVPPKIELPPPESVSDEVKTKNWPKDPDESRRKAAIAARKKENKDPLYSSRVLTSSELNAGKTAAPARTNNNPNQPGASSNPILSPGQLGYTGGLFGNIFGGNKGESAPFAGEPTRETLTQPPTGYQTPSPNFAYGTGPRENVSKRFDILSGKEVNN